MTAFLIKSAIAMAVLLVLYYLLLGREKMHRFNRFYLLGAVIFSFVLPFINIPVYVEAPVQSFQDATEVSEIVMAQQTTPGIAHGVVIKPATNYIPYIVWSIYGIVTLLLAIRFAINISHFIRKLANNEKIPYKNATLVLLNENTLPHTFLNYIFINGDDYRANAIENDLYTHELTHVKQWHTLDILFIEMLKTVLWFNPLLYMYKKAIQLNHEFLADEKVVSTSETANYQLLLLQKTSCGMPIHLASNLNFSITKKRFIMMTKTTPNSKAATLKAVLAPVIVGILFILCTKTIAQSTGSLAALEKDPDIIALFKDTEFTFKYPGDMVIKKTYTELTEEEKTEVYTFMPTGPMQRNNPTQKQLDKWENAKNFVIQLDMNYVPNEKIEKLKPKDIAMYYDYNQNFKDLDTVQVFTESFFTANFLNKEYTTDYSTCKGLGLTYDEEDLKRKKDVKTTLETVDVTKQPEFPGGLDGLYSFINKNFVIPEDVKSDLKIYVRFYIEEDGTVTEPYVMRVTDGNNTAMEMKRVLLKSPKWEPAEKDGKKVRVYYTLPVKINVNK